MKKVLKLLAIVLLTFTLSLAGQNNNSKIYNMSNFQIDSLLQENSNTNMNIADRINYFSQKFLGMPYDLNCVGDGPYALYEDWPLVNFDETNCMAFVEHVLALSISDNWDNFFNNLQKIRYKDGIIGMRTRNHFTIADWLPQNKWLLKNVTSQVENDFLTTVTRTIPHESFFKNKGLKDLRYIKEDRTITKKIIKEKYLSQIKNYLQKGDILSLIYRDKDNIFSAHMVMIASKNGQKVVRESSNSKMTTFDTKYDQWAQEVQQEDRTMGIIVMRVKDNLNKPGKIILPWNIKELRN